MLLEPNEEHPPYSGPYVTIRPTGAVYRVAIEPVLASGDGEPRIFDSKHGAWWQVLTFARAHKLPIRDFTISETARAFDEA